MTEITNVSPIETIRRNPDSDQLENTKVRLVALKNNGNDARETITPPKSRGLVIAVGKKGQLVVTFLQGNLDVYGYHVLCEGWAVKAMGMSNLLAILHGEIFNEAKIREKGRHVIRIAKINPEDTAQLGDTSNVPAWEIDGKLNPEKYLRQPGFDIPNRLLKALNAERIEITEAEPSASIYGLRNSTRSGK